MNGDLLTIPLSQPQSPIIPIMTSDPHALAALCETAGFVVHGIQPPTVPIGKSRIRVCIHAGNTLLEVETFVALLELWAISKSQQPDVAASMGTKMEAVKARL